jgi:hypothetical protein
MQPGSLTRTADYEQCRQENPNRSEREMNPGFKSLAGPESPRENKALDPKPGSPKHGEGPGQPSSCAIYFEEDLGGGNAGNSHQKQNQTNEECMDAEDGGVDRAQQLRFFIPFEPSADGPM